MLASDQALNHDPDQRAGHRPEALTIRISAGRGTGLTRLAAFDAALRDAGVGDFNLIRMSSVIPPGSTLVEVSDTAQVSGTHGDRLYCVYADAYASNPLEQAWAGMAWSTRDDRSGAGLFVEHAGSSRSTVEHELELSLGELSRGRGGRYAAAGQKVASIDCVDHPVCVVVIATYRSTPWSDHGC